MPIPKFQIKLNHYSKGQRGEWGRRDDLTLLLNQLDECIYRILQNVEVKYHINPACLSIEIKSEEK